MFLFKHSCFCSGKSRLTEAKIASGLQGWEPPGVWGLEAQEGGCGSPTALVAVDENRKSETGGAPSLLAMRADAP